MTKRQYLQKYFYRKPFLPGFGTFPGIWILWNKYTGFVEGASKIVVNGRIHCELQIRVQVFEKFNQRKFSGPLNIQLAVIQTFHTDLIFRGP